MEDTVKEADENKSIKISAQAYAKIVEWADREHRTLMGMIDALCEVYAGTREPGD